ncbi:hypothetical protein C8T65DRAFT_750401 [Cerioporus squamosus]|nr:hypothetical protein C8T65DRAFT_750401 [Cerioporus squamosus]
MLSSIASAEGFLAFTRTRPDGQQPVVRHLSLTLLSGLKVHRTRLHSFGPHSDLTAERQRQAEDKRETLQARFIEAANELFVLVAPTLRTLCLTTGYFLPLAPIPCDMPVLEELTIMGSISTITGATSASRFPALKRFHLIPRSANANRDVCTTALTASALCTAPLSHLRLSHVHAHERPELSSLLRRTLSVPAHPVPFQAEDHDGGVLRDRGQATLPCIREVVVHTIIPDLGWCGNAYVDYRRETAVFDGFVQACNWMQGMQVLALQRRQRNFRWKERLYNDWVSRIEGGRGCWVQDDAQEAALEMSAERQGDVFRSDGDIIRSWVEDDFSGGDGGHHCQDALADLLNEGAGASVVDREAVDDVLQVYDPDDCVIGL